MPLRDPDQVDCCCRKDVLQARFGEADVAAPAQAAAADCLRVRALNPGTGGVAVPERLGSLLLARAMQRLEVLARLHSNEALVGFRGGGEFVTQPSRR